MPRTQKIRKIRKMYNPDKNPDPEFREQILKLFSYSIENKFLNEFFPEKCEKSKKKLLPYEVIFFDFYGLPWWFSKPDKA